MRANDLKTKPRRFRKGDASFTLRHDDGNLYRPRATRNPRNVWTLPATPFRGAHFATFPKGLPRQCILAASKPGDTVLDPFGGSGTTGVVADQLGRNAVLLDISPEYVRLMRKRMADAGGLPMKPMRKVADFRSSGGALLSYKLPCNTSESLLATSGHEKMNASRDFVT